MERAKARLVAEQQTEQRDEMDDLWRQWRCGCGHRESTREGAILSLYCWRKARWTISVSRAGDSYFDCHKSLFVVTCHRGLSHDAIPVSTSVSRNWCWCLGCSVGICDTFCDVRQPNVTTRTCTRHLAIVHQYAPTFDAVRRGMVTHTELY